MDIRKSYKTKKPKEKDMEIARKLRDIRKDDIKITQDNLAEKIGVEQATVSSWEAEGVVPGHKTVEEICNMPERKIRPAWVLYGEEPKYVDQKRGTIKQAMPDTEQYEYKGEEKRKEDRRKTDRRIDDIKKKIVNNITAFDDTTEGKECIKRIINFLKAEVINFRKFKQ